jgi:hypothetical protein
MKVLYSQYWLSVSLPFLKMSSRLMNLAVLSKQSGLCRIHWWDELTLLNLNGHGKWSDMFNVVYRHLLGRAEEDHSNSQIACLWNEIWTRDLPHMKQEW